MFIIILLSVLVVGCKKSNQDYSCCTMSLNLSTNNSLNLAVCNTDTEGKSEFKIKDVEYTTFYSKQKFECACTNKKLDNLTVGIEIKGEFPSNKMLADNIFDYC